MFLYIYYIEDANLFIELSMLLKYFIVYLYNNDHVIFYTVVKVTYRPIRPGVLLCIAYMSVNTLYVNTCHYNKRLSYLICKAKYLTVALIKYFTIFKN